MNHVDLQITLSSIIARSSHRARSPRQIGQTPCPRRCVGRVAPHQVSQERVRPSGWTTRPPATAFPPNTAQPCRSASRRHLGKAKPTMNRHRPSQRRLALEYAASAVPFTGGLPWLLAGQGPSAFEPDADRTPPGRCRGTALKRERRAAGTGQASRADGRGCRLVRMAFRSQTLAQGHSYPAMRLPRPSSRALACRVYRSGSPALVRWVSRFGLFPLGTGNQTLTPTPSGHPQKNRHRPAGFGNGLRLYLMKAC